MTKTILPLLAAGGLALAGAAHGATITGLYNTGLDAAGVVLASDGLADAHWIIASSTSGAEYTGATPYTYTNGIYAPNDADSRWLSLSGTGTPVGGTTIYRLSFDLTGFDLSSVVIGGRWGADNGGVIVLNGVDTAFSLAPGGLGSFTSLHDFSLSSGFVAGVNTLDVRVVDQGGVTAFRVDDLVGSAELASGGGVPEPATWALMILGFGGAGAALRRQGKADPRRPA